MQEPSIEKTYQKKTQLEHILLRPDTYVGSVESITSSLWILDSEAFPPRFINKSIEYIPGLYKIFDEILVNAADNHQRDRKMDTIKVRIDPKSNLISVWNNGKGIPIQIHKVHNIYVPELIFGHLLTSSNYDDTQKKVTGGRNGYGAKLTNIFSTKFTVETGDSKMKKSFKMTWNNNMSSNSEPLIESYSGEDFTCVSFEPDLKRFGIKVLDANMLGLMQKRVYDLAGVIASKIKVHLNGKKIETAGFQSYVDMYFPSDSTNIEKVCDTAKNKTTERWEVVAALSEGQFQQVSFVNGICTSKGGTHVAYVTDQIVDKLLEILKKKHKDLKIKPFQIKSFIWIFINSMIENPAFDSQTKETLTTKASNFGSEYEISEKFIKDLLKTNIINNIVLQAQAKEHAKMAKTLTGQKKSRLLGIPKLEDANDAGTKNSEYCTLILTEGDSAKSLAMAGIEVVGRDRYGVFPLKGKLLNVREATPKQSSENQELQNLIKILGLQFGKNYDAVKSLRYGAVMVMADQDYDGSHIKGLVINFLHTFWPSLLRMNGFVKEFVTPIIKATKSHDVRSFFTINDYSRWLEGMPIEEQKKWSVKYYKGLGTSTNKEAKEYFEKVNKHQLNFLYRDQTDDDAIDLAFSKKKADDRKEWLLNFDPENTVDHTQKQLRYVDFINKELIQFSYHDNIRSIPCICDGLKPGQRKILFSCFKRNLKAELKVAQLSGYVAEHSAYHHGEISLSQTIIGMAQTFVGSNNINLLQPIGQFGSRNMGGKDAASARYIYTNLSKLTRKLFIDADDHLYDYIKDDGQMVEPKWYLPIIPMVLVNGSEGIGTGWSTNIPCYNPKEIAEIIKKKLLENDTEFIELAPWFKGFKGEITQREKNYSVIGKYKKLGEDMIEIYELPISKWTRDYKSFLEGKWEGGDEEAVIDDIKEFHTGENVDFVVKLKEGKLQEIEKYEGGVEKFFRLTGNISTNNMVLFDPHGKLKKYGSICEILQEFYELRLKYYAERKKFLISQRTRDLELLQNKLRFITEILDDTLKLKHSKKEDILNELQKKGYKSSKTLTKICSSKHELMKEEEEKNVDDDESIKDFNYLLSLPIWSLSYEKVEALRQEVKSKEADLMMINAKSPEDFWIEDLDVFLSVYNEEFHGEKANNAVEKGKLAAGKQVYMNKAGVSKKKKDEDDDFECRNTEKMPIEKKVLSRKKINIKKKEDYMEEEEEEIIGKITVKKEKNSVNEKKFTNKTINSNEKKVQEIEKKVPEIDKKVKMEENNNKMKINKVNNEIKQQDKENKFTLDNSILKYLIPRNPKPVENLTNTTNLTKNPALLSLEERLRLRETKGDLKSFEESYKHDSNTPIKELLMKQKCDENITGSKRKLIDLNEKNSEGEETLEELLGNKVKKVKIDDEDEVVMMDFSEGKKSGGGEVNGNRPIRAATKNRKVILDEDSENE